MLGLYAVQSNLQTHAKDVQVSGCYLHNCVATEHSVDSAFLTQVFDPNNPYLADDTYSKQMKNLHWLLGAPHEIFLRIDGKMLMNDQKDDIMRDTLVRDMFYGSGTLNLPWICCTASSLV